MSVSSLPETVKGLFPKENLEFCASITEEESKILRQVFQQHGCFEKVGEMIQEVGKHNKPLSDRLQHVLEENKKRLIGLSPDAVDYAKKVITMVTHLLCSLTLGKSVDESEAKRLHDEFKNLSECDQSALKLNNPDIKF